MLIINNEDGEVGTDIEVGHCIKADGLPIGQCNGDVCLTGPAIIGWILRGELLLILQGGTQRALEFVKCSQFPYDISYRMPLDWAKRGGNVLKRTVNDHGGHCT
jgi:hypothetical protein